MLNSKPTGAGHYKQGLYKPININKVIKLNAMGGLYYRSSLEQKVMIYLDNNPNIIRWCAEYISIEYELTDIEFKTSRHTYYPDFYYELQKSNGDVSRVVMEVKPESVLHEPKLPVKSTRKQLENLEYALKMFNKNKCKWDAAVAYCNRKGFKFILVTEETFERYRII
jgi:hypothetical protein